MIIPPQEYVRAKNCNTPRYWDVAHKRNRDVTPVSTKVAHVVHAKLNGERVAEYGFGSGKLARMIGVENWQGFEFSKVAVGNVRAEGFTAEVQWCRDAAPPEGVVVIALEVLEHLDRDEMDTFIQAIKGHECYLSVPRPKERDSRFQQHMRSFGTLDDFHLFLMEWWPKVEVEKVGIRWALARCRP